MTQIALKVLGFLAYTFPKWCCWPARLHSDCHRKRSRLYKYVWLADPNNSVWRKWREMVLKGPTKLLGKDKAYKWRCGLQGIKLTGKTSQFYRREK